MEAGDVCFLGAGIRHAIGAFSDDSIAVNIILRRSAVKDCFISLLSREDILARFFHQVFYDSEACSVIIFHTGDDQRICGQISLLEEEAYEIRDCYTPQMAEAYVLGLFGMLMRFYINHITVIDRERKYKDENLIACFCYLDNHVKDITLNELSRRFHYSPSQLSKLIKRYLGCSFLEYIKSKKLKNAKQLLATADVPVKNIAEMCGFADNSYFYRCFRSAFHMTPLEYRDKYMRQQAHE